ncbi:MAG: hypothetical protein Q8R01_04305 [Ramlibacter sp.]|nr:hypothetical protein [Ramlibacter sp.]
MASLFWKTFGGLSAAYYFRHFFFGLMFPVLTYFGLRDNLYPPPLLPTSALVAANTLLYPYARFVYESIVQFFLGENVFYVNSGVLLFCKFLTMLLCWFFALFIAPIGLLYLYVVHTRDG